MTLRRKGPEDRRPKPGGRRAGSTLSEATVRKGGSVKMTGTVEPDIKTHPLLKTDNLVYFRNLRLRSVYLRLFVLTDFFIFFVRYRSSAFFRSYWIHLNLVVFRFRYPLNPQTTQPSYSNLT
ncbi:hypothetical protein BDM02DRAFT_1192525 [Thelephora ganbajun]|uniref:Uncharacterized protein n=1 Tax=Thelephora ganbajun TaxID=370292 RepID=A0ACB6ZWX3_THEGA|nr:hypothetical protein BDM02DRAFT_1192525 [Thelephora ganbajun]